MTNQQRRVLTSLVTAVALFVSLYAWMLYRSLALIPDVVCDGYLGIGSAEGMELISQGEWLKAAMIFGAMADEVSGNGRVCSGPAREFGLLFPFQAVALKRIREHYLESERARVNQEFEYRAFYAIALQGLGLKQQADLEIMQLAEIKFDGDLDGAEQHIATLRRLSTDGDALKADTNAGVVED